VTDWPRPPLTDLSHGDATRRDATGGKERRKKASAKANNNNNNANKPERERQESRARAGEAASTEPIQSLLREDRTGEDGARRLTDGPHLF